MSVYPPKIEPDLNLSSDPAEMMSIFLHKMQHNPDQIPSLMKAFSSLNSLPQKSDFSKRHVTVPKQDFINLESVNLVGSNPVTLYTCELCDRKCKS